MKYKLHIFHFIISIIALANITFAQSTITIGSGTGSGTYTPIASWYNSSATESIYLGSEIGISGNITKIGYNKASGSSITNPYIKIYLKTTSANNVGMSEYSIGTSGFGDYILVYEGLLPNGSTTGWMEVDLSTPFSFTSTSNNLSVLIVGSTCISSGRPQYRYTTTTSRMSSTYDDGSIACGGSTMWDASMVFTPKWERPNILLTMNTLSTECLSPLGLTSTSISHNSANISWATVSDVIGYEYYYSTSSIPPATSFTGTPTSETSISLYDLIAGTTYYIWTKSVCSSISKSAWSSAYTFTTTATTSCNPPSATTITTIDTTSASVVWTGATSALSYEVYYNTSSIAPSVEDIGFSASGTSMGLIDLMPSTIYYVWIRSKCSSDLYSSWNGPIYFTTLCHIPRVDSFDILKIDDYTFQFLPKEASYVENYIWNFGDGSTSTIPNPTHSYTTNGEYVIKLCVKNECIDDCTIENSYTKSISINNTTSIIDLKTENKFSIYPNPAQNHLYIESNNLKINNIVIYNMLGEKISTYFENELPISLQNIAMGFYLLKIETQSGIYYYKFQKHIK